MMAIIPSMWMSKPATDGEVDAGYPLKHCTLAANVAISLLTSATSDFVATLLVSAFTRCVPISHNCGQLIL